ncbi:hypothetical protein [Kitasatospora sp. NPDC001527]|uniref:hypothetical protein n=1 Tax=Kitasatospora sp. NPDC001527 TaxID=3154519 RepID=UPI0033274312
MNNDAIAPGTERRDQVLRLIGEGRLYDLTPARPTRTSWTASGAMPNPPSAHSVRSPLRRTNRSTL